MDSPSPMYNANSASVRRLMKECKEMEQDPSTLYTAAPLEDNLFEWHFTIRGPKDTEFEGGVYHGRILFPSDYPYRPPDIVFLTKNGRFELEKKICLTISSHHEETWRPSWSIRTVLVALIAFMPSKGDGAIASLDWTEEERRKLATLSLTYKCDKCGSHNSTALKPEDENEKLTAEDVPEELQLRDSSKKADQPAASSSSSAASAPSSSISSSSYATERDYETSSVVQRPSSHTHPDSSFASTTAGSDAAVVDEQEDFLNAPTHPIETPLYQPPPMMMGSSSGHGAEQPAPSVRAILREQLDNVLSIIVLLIGLLSLYKISMYL